MPEWVPTRCMPDMTRVRQRARHERRSCGDSWMRSIPSGSFRSLNVCGGRPPLGRPTSPGSHTCRRAPVGAGIDDAAQGGAAQSCRSSRSERSLCWATSSTTCSNGGRRAGSIHAAMVVSQVVSMSSKLDFHSRARQCLRRVIASFALTACLSSLAPNASQPPRR